MKKLNPPFNITNSLFEKLRNKSKNKLDFKRKHGLGIPDKSIKNNINLKQKTKEDNNIKIIEDYDSFKNSSKLNNLSKDVINKYTSEKENRNSSYSLLRVFSNPKELIMNNVNSQEKIMIYNNVLSSRTRVKPVLSSNPSINNINNVPNSPNDLKAFGPNGKQCSNYTKFAHNTKHKKGSKSISYQFNISSINMMKQKSGNRTNVQTSSNLSYEKDEKNYQKSNDIKACNHLKNKNTSNEILGLLAMNNSKSICKFSTDSSTKSSVAIPPKSKMEEVESPEELHYLYVKIFRNNKSLAYKFENENFEEKLNEGSIEF